MPRDREGFTLVELLVGVTLSGFAIAIAAGIFGSVTESLVTLDRSARKTAELMEGRLWLAEALLSVDGSGPDADPFRGSMDGVGFAGRHWMGTGWTEPTDITVGLEGSELVGRAGPHRRVLRGAVGSVTFSYLGDLGAASRWEASWDDGRTPRAVRLVVAPLGSGAPDTTLFLVGGS